MQLPRGLPWSVGNNARAGNGGVLADSAVFLVRPAGRTHLEVEVLYMPGKGKC